MKHSKSRFVALLPIALAALLIAGCGGGGDDGPSVVVPIPTPTPTPTPTPVEPAPADLQPLMASSYPAGSAAAHMFNEINRIRTACGFGALRHDPRLDVSAQNHAVYIASNTASASVNAHEEIPGRLGFTGVTPGERALFAGYGSNLVGEGISTEDQEDADIHRAFVPGQLSASYHALLMLGPLRDIGFGESFRSQYGFVDSAGTYQPFTPTVVHVHNMGTLTDSQKLAEGVVRTYPCEGEKVGQTFHTVEEPNPLGTRRLLGDPAGHPIMLMSRIGSTLTEVQVVLQHGVTGATLEMAAIRTQANDAYITQGNRAFAIPDKELEANTSYRVQVSGKVDGKPFDQSFTFSTGDFTIATYRTGRRF